MNLRKLLAILLTLALLLGIAPAAGANGAVDGTTTFDSSTVTPSLATAADSEEQLPPIIGDKIDVKITNIYNIQVNPYGMNIKEPGPNGKPSSDSIVTTPILIENNTGLKVDVTATATAVPEGDVVLDSDPTRYAYEHTPTENPDDVPSEERVYLYLKMTDQFDSNQEPVWPTETNQDGETVEKVEVITKDGGSDPLKATMQAGTASNPTYAALQIGGDTSLPTYYGSWHLGNGFKVNLVLSFDPKMEGTSYNVRFDAADVWSWYLDEEKRLEAPVDLLIKSKDEDGNESTETHTFEGNYTTHDELTDGFTVSSKENLTFTIKTRFNGTEETFYSIHSVKLFKQSGESGKTVTSLGDAYEWSEEGALIVEKTYTINVAEVYKQLNAGETLYIRLSFSMVSPPENS